MPNLADLCTNVGFMHQRRAPRYPVRPFFVMLVFVPSAVESRAVNFLGMPGQIIPDTSGQIR